MANCLVTGGAGFMGSHVAGECLARGHDVTVVDDLSGGYERNVPEGARFIKADITRPDDVAAIFRNSRFDFVYHLAAYAAEGLSHFIRNFNYTNNVVGSVNLINAAVNHGIRCFVYTSSIAVYGSAQVPMTEDTTPRPEDPYGIAKYAIELDLEAAHNMFGLDYVIFRPHNVYGEGQNTADRYRNVIGIFMNQIMQGEPMTIFGDGEQTRAFSYIRDVAPVIADAVDVEEAYNRVFNLGADEPYSVNELARVIAKSFGVDPDITYLAARKEVVHAYSSHDQLHAVFGKRKATSLQDGIEAMAAWAKSVGPLPPSVFGGIEVSRNLPPSWARVVEEITQA
ncbi:MAG: NAD-dependent epimerase/dehydratase family protein [Actinomycetota bacterium]